MIKDSDVITHFVVVVHENINKAHKILSETFTGRYTIFCQNCFSKLHIWIVICSLCCEPFLCNLSSTVTHYFSFKRNYRRNKKYACGFRQIHGHFHQ